MEHHPSKSHLDAIHQHVRLYYLQTPQSSRKLLRAGKPSSGRIASIHKPGMNSRIAQRTEHRCIGTTNLLRRSTEVAQYTIVIQNIQRIPLCIGQ